MENHATQTSQRKWRNPEGFFSFFQQGSLGLCKFVIHSTINMAQTIFIYFFANAFFSFKIFFVPFLNKLKILGTFCNQIFLIWNETSLIKSNYALQWKCSNSVCIKYFYVFSYLYSSSNQAWTTPKFGVINWNQEIEELLPITKLESITKLLPNTA